MNIKSKQLVSNTDMIKNYKVCREKAEANGKVFVIKNNQLDAVLFSISQYEKLSKFIEFVENLEAEEISAMLKKLPKDTKGNSYTMNDIKKGLEL